jgi:hypothetical protein
MTGNALFINGSSHITLSNSKLTATADGQVPHNADGLYALNSRAGCAVTLPCSLSGLSSRCRDK